MKPSSIIPHFFLLATSLASPSPDPSLSQRAWRFNRISSTAQDAASAVGHSPNSNSGSATSGTQKSCEGSPSNPAGPCTEDEKPYNYGAHFQQMHDDGPSYVKSLDRDFYHTGGAHQSFIPPKDISGVTPEKLSAKKAAKLYKGDWVGEVFSWNMTFSSDVDGIETNGTLVCLCEASAPCGCGEAGWTGVDGFSTNKTVEVNEANGQAVVAVNGTATLGDLDTEERLIREKKERSQAASQEYEDISAGVRHGFHWEVLGVVGAVALGLMV